MIEENYEIESALFKSLNQNLNLDKYIEKYTAHLTAGNTKGNISEFEQRRSIAQRHQV